MTKRNWIFAVIAAAALIVHFWPMADWNSTTLVLLRITAAFFAQLYFCRREWKLPVRLLPLLVTALLALWGGWLFCASPSWDGVAFPRYVWDYCAPVMACAAAWTAHWIGKKRAHRVCWALSALLAVGFALKVALDYVVYTTTLNSAPFYLWVVVDGIYFLVPAAILLGIGWKLKK